MDAISVAVSTSVAKQIARFPKACLQYSVTTSPVICDRFDASRIFKSDTNQDTQILGTTGYAAPEQYGIAQTDERADIYSLGVLLNIMLTGKHPSKELASGRLGRIVQKCTMVNPKKRYKSVLYLMEAL